MREIVREFLVSEGVPFARLRRREHFTPYAARIRIMEEDANKPPEFRAKRLSRRLTKLDRLLSDDEAYALDMAQQGWLILNGRGKSIDPGGVFAGGGGDSMPLNARELGIARAFQELRGKIGWGQWGYMQELFSAIAPWSEVAYNVDIARAARLAQAILMANRAREQK